MLTLPKIILFLTAMLFVWFYYQGIRVRERALLVGRNYCKQFGVQFLDETVQRERVSLSRNEQGNWQVWRRFSFEFTESGENRQTGNITMLGYRVQLVELGGQRILH